MKTKTLIVGGVSALAIAIAGVTVASAAQNSTTTNNMWQKLKGNQTEHRQEMKNLFTTGSYDAWKTAVDEKQIKMAEKFSDRFKVTEYITADNFDKFVQMHDLMKEGKKDEAEVIRQELGLPEYKGKGKGMYNGRKMGNKFVDKDGNGVCDHLDKK